MTRKKVKDDSLLEGQRLKSPKSRKKRKLSRAIHVTGTVMVVGVFLAGGIYLAKRAKSTTTTLTSKPMPNATPHTVQQPVEFAFDELTTRSLPPATLQKITNYVNANPPNLSQYAYLQAYAQKLQEVSGTSSIQLIRTNEDRLLIRSHERRPILRIAADKVRLVTAEGLVYGTATPEDETLPILTGLLDGRAKKITMESDGTLVLRSDEAQAITAALTFFNEPETSRLGFKTVEWLPYRGVEAKTENFDVIFGLPPYGERYQKLVKIISDLNKKGVTAAKVELDYPDKAFVKQLSVAQPQNSSGL